MSGWRRAGAARLAPLCLGVWAAWTQAAAAGGRDRPAQLAPARATIERAGAAAGLRPGAKVLDVAPPIDGGAVPAGARPVWTGPRRDIRVCVLNYAGSPAPERLLMDALAAVSWEYEENAGISFTVGALRPFSGDLTAWPLDLGPQLRRECPSDTELRMVFVNGRMFRRDLSALADRAEGSIEDEFAGASHPYFGYLVLYDVEARSRQTDAAGNPGLVSVLKHEIGHLFGLEHSPDRRSFMSTPSLRGTGEWTPEVLRAIIQHRGKRWFPRA